MADDLHRNKKWFAGLDCLRFILALIVLLSHFNNPFIELFLKSPYPIINLSGQFLTYAFDGTAAVIAFFIISGFVIHYPNKNGIKSLKTFWLRRFTRVFIPLIIISIIGIWFHHPEKAVVWSLICELAYYAIYPLLFKINISWRKQFLSVYIIALIIICIGARYDVVSFFTQTAAKYHGYYWQLGIFVTWIVGLPVWLLGVLMAENIDRLHNISFSKIFFYRLFIFALSCFFSAAKLYWHLSYILSMNVFALLIYQWIQAEINYFKRKTPNKALEKMGKFSYSLYLCHPLIYLILGFWINSGVYTYPLLIIITIAVAYVFYLLVEKPAHALALKLSRNNA